MRKKLKQIGISIQELSDLLLVHHKTITSWFVRNTIIPQTHSPYLSAITQYATHYASSDLTDFEQLFTQKSITENKAVIQKAINRINQELSRLNYKHEQLNTKWKKQISRIHFSEHYDIFLASEHHNSTVLQDWLQLINKKSRFESHKLWLAKHKITERIAALEGQLLFLKNQIGH